MKSLAVFIDGSPNDETSLASALTLARQFSSQLTVLHPHQPELIPTAAFEGVGTVIDNTAEVRAASSAAKAAFAKVVGNQPNVRLVELNLDLGDVVQKAALYQDLVMLERVSASEGPDVALLSAALWEGRIPVLVLPTTPIKPQLSTVVLAWNRTAAAAHALRAALPLIRSAQRLVVLSREGASAEDPELKTYLAAEGVSVAEWKNYGAADHSARAWGRALLAECATQQADLLVMGAFGSSLENWFGFGRATQKICANTTLPVFLHA